MSNPSTTSKNQLQATLSLHLEWLGSNGRSGKRLNAAGEDLAGANLRGANMRGAVLSGAGLEGANLRGVDMRGANLHGAYLDEAKLEGAKLRGANLLGANLRGVKLRWADMRGADMRGADMRGAFLEGANLSGTSLAGAKLDFPVYAHEGGEPESWHDRNQMLYGIKDGGQLIIICGCRWMPVADALAYWGSPNYHRGQELGAKKVALVNKIVEGVANGATPPNS